MVANPAKDTITFNLLRPDAEFLYQLAVPFTSILPASAPPKDSGIKPIPGTGPYYFSKYDPSHELVMSRNPHFKVWSQLAQPQGYPDTIVTTFGLTSESEVTAIENGQADWMYDAVPSDRLSELSTKYAKQVQVDPVAGVFYVPMNTNLAAVQQQARAPGRQLGDRSEPARQAVWRHIARSTGLHDPAARLPGTRRLLPVHEGRRHDLEGARPREGQGARASSPAPPASRSR